MTDAMFQDAFDALPDLDSPPAGNHFIGDVAKVRGELWVFDGRIWKHWKTAKDEAINIEEEAENDRHGRARSAGTLSY